MRSLRPHRPWRAHLTLPGEVLLVEARTLLSGVESARGRVRRAAGDQVLNVGVLGPGEMALSAQIADSFALDQPEVTVALHQGSFDDPTLGLTSSRVDVAITFAPFDETGLVVRAVSEERLFAAVAASHGLASKPTLTADDIRGCASVRFPDHTDSLWCSFWQPNDAGDGPLVRSLDECLHAVLWQHAVALVPERVVRNHRVEGIRYLPIEDAPVASLVLAWRRRDRSKAVATYVAALSSELATGG